MSRNRIPTVNFSMPNDRVEISPYLGIPQFRRTASGWERSADLEVDLRDPEIRILCAVAGLICVGSGLGILAAAATALSPYIILQVPVGLAILGMGTVSVASAVTGRNYFTPAARMINGALERVVLGNSRGAENRVVPEQNLDELLDIKKQLPVTENETELRKIRGIRDLLESEYSMYRFAAVDFISYLPDQATANDVAILSDYYFSDRISRNATGILERITEDERSTFHEKREFFTQNLTHLNNGPQLGGRIDDVKMSQAIFLSLIVGSIKHKEIILGTDFSEKVSQKVNQISSEEVESLENALDRHLLATYRESGENSHIKMAVLYGHQLVRDGESSTIGAPRVNQQQETANIDLEMDGDIEMGSLRSPRGERLDGSASQNRSNNSR